MSLLSLKRSLPSDLVAGSVVFFVALPLCLGVALGSNAPLFSGLLAGIIGGLIVGAISGSQVSVSGPSAGLTAVAAAQIQELGSFEAFLVAVVLAGILQIIFAGLKMGYISGFFPSSVIKGLLWSIGLILVLKQIPHLFGNDIDPMGSSTFHQQNEKNTFTELVETFFDYHLGAAVIGIFSLLTLTAWEYFSWLKRSKIAAPVVVIVLSILISNLFSTMGEQWDLYPHHLVQVPVADSLKGSFTFFVFPSWSSLQDPAVYVGAVTIALVISLETLLNLEALDKIDPSKRPNPPNRELLAQGIGNITGGLLGALPLSSVIVRSSVNIHSGGRTKISTIWHGLLLASSLLLFPALINQIPLSALAAILILTGLKLSNAKVFMQMWREGKNQFLPFIITLGAILLTDLLVGILIGLALSICFILRSNITRPLSKIMEKHATGESVLHIELPNQVSFLNRATLEMTLKSIPAGGHVLIDAKNTDYIDPDILDLIEDFQRSASAHKVTISLAGFKDRYPQIEDRIQYVDFTTRELQDALTPYKALEILKEGNIRFRKGTRLTRSLERQLDVASIGQFPMAVILSCIDSRAPVELIFDLGIGDIFTIRIAGNVVSRKILGSMEYSCAIAGAKLVVVMGHTSCGAVKASVDLLCNQKSAEEATGCSNLDSLVGEIQQSFEIADFQNFSTLSEEQKRTYLDNLAYRNVLHSIRKIRQDSPILEELIQQKKIAIVGGVYNVSSAEVTFFSSTES